MLDFRRDLKDTTNNVHDFRSRKSDICFASYHIKMRYGILLANQLVSSGSFN